MTDNTKRAKALLAEYPGPDGAIEAVTLLLDMQMHTTALFESLQEVNRLIDPKNYLRPHADMFWCDDGDEAGIGFDTLDELIAHLWDSDGAPGDKFTISRAMQFPSIEVRLIYPEESPDTLGYDITKGEL